MVLCGSRERVHIGGEGGSDVLEPGLEFDSSCCDVQARPTTGHAFKMQLSN